MMKFLFFCLSVFVTLLMLWPVEKPSSAPTDKPPATEPDFIDKVTIWLVENTPKK